MRRLVSILVTVLLSMTATAQLLQPDYSVPSPHAASLGEYGEVPVSHFTGNLFDSYTQNSLMGDNWFELSADEFSFSMNGHSGRFYLNPTGDWTVVSDEDIVVEFDASEGFLGLQGLSTRIPEVLWWSNRGNNVRWFKAFTLITPDGVRYEFGGLDAMDFSISYYNRDESDLIATSWHLSRIITPEGREIDFEYQTDQLLCDLRYTTGHTISYGFPSGNPEFLRQSIHGRSGLSGSLLFPASLSRIISPADTLNVTYYEDRSYSHLYSQYYADVLYWETPEDHPVNLYSYEWSFQTDQFFELLPITGAQTQVESRQANTNDGEITENDVMYKNVGTSATFALDDGSYGIHYQNMRVARANVPISFESLVEQNPGIVGRLLGTQSSLSEEAKEALMQDCIRTGQAVFLNAPETRFIVGALMTVLFLPEDVVSILDMPKKAFHLLRIEEKEGLRIEEILKDFVLEKKSKGKRIGYVEGRVLESDFKNLAKQYGKSYVNKRGVEMIDVPTGSITRHISTQTGKPTLNIPVEGRIYKIRYDR